MVEHTRSGRTIEHYRGYEIECYHTGPWDVTYQWSKQPWDLGLPIGYEPSIEACKRAIDVEIDGECPACNDTGLVKDDPFDSVADVPCPDCRVS